MMTSGTQKLVGKLYELARLYRVQASYRDVGGRQRKSSTESLMAVLRALGAPITKLEDIPHAFRERERQLWEACSSRSGWFLKAAKRNCRSGFPRNMRTLQSPVISRSKEVKRRHGI